MACGEILSRSLGIRIVEPVERLIRVISDILESGNLTQRVEWASRDEMGTLAGLFNAMLAKIDTEQVALQEQRTRELEQEVIRQKKDQDRLRLAIADARAATRAKSDFLANMSHEIRTPMNGIIGMAELVLESDLSRDQEQMVSTISAEAEALLSIINTILDFSKIEAGKMDLEHIPFNLRILFEDLAATLAVTAGKKGLDFNAYMPPDIPEALTGDPGRLRQILVNLAGNAVKFTPEGEVFVRIETALEKAEGVEIRFCIEDTGIGISEDRRELIFDSFSQADGSTTRQYGGTGLGTTIAKQLVEMMGGTIGFENRAQGGTRFWFTVVLQKEHDAPGREPGPVVPDAPRVLVADTSATSCRCIAGYLEAMGCRPVEATDGQQVRRIVSEKEGTQIAMILLDRRMQDRDGGRLVSRMASAAAPEAVPLVCLASAWDLDFSPADASSQAFLIQGTYVLAKPVRLAELEGIVRTVLADGVWEPPRQLPEGHEKIPGRGIRVLLAEDYPANQDVAKRHLTAAGYGVSIAESGEQAVTLFGEERFDLVLMDIQMPGMDGYEATRQIRKREGNTGRVPVIALTAHAVKGYREKCLAAGMDDYLPKPLAGRTLIQMVEKWTAGRPGPPAWNEALEETREEPLEETGPRRGDMTAPVDMTAAMTEFRNDAAFYKKIFTVFMGSLAERLDLLEQAVSKRDYPAAANQAHTIKGGAGNVAAMPLYEMAQSLEKACEKEDPERVARMVKAVKEEYGRLKAFGRTLGE